MKITHHVNDDFLYLYAAGELNFGWRLAVATHLAMCSKCRKKHEMFEMALATSLEEAESVEMTASVDTIIDKADAIKPEVQTPQLQQSKSGNYVFSYPLRELSGDLDEINWSTMGGGMKQKILHEENGVIARLLYIPAGVAASSHGHNGVELTQVVVGGFFDGDRAYSCGDIQTVGHQNAHQPVAMNDGPCICLAVTDAPLRFQNFLPRVFQKFFNI